MRKCFDLYQILSIKSLRNVWRSVWRIGMLMLGLKGIRGLWGWCGNIDSVTSPWKQNSYF